MGIGHHLETFRKLTASIPVKGKVNLSWEVGSTIAKIELNSPSTRNALTPSMMIDLAEIVDSLTYTSPPTYLVLAGANGTFCSGADIGVAKDTLMTTAGGSAMAGLMNSVTDAISSLRTVSFSAIDGAAYGGGAELCTATDFRCMRHDAKIRFVQCKMGVTTGWGGGRRLAEIVGKKEALRLLLLSEKVDADSAVRLGLADFMDDRKKKKKEGRAAEFREAFFASLGRSVADADMYENSSDFSSGDYALDLIERLKTPDDLVHSLKSVVGAKSAEEEIREFEKHWAADSHVLAFNQATAAKNK
mmetsp:Transcript_22516/g.44991  ORF Transcript_22516/g.44991 Transcript_22516/m.44991 type:complete len:303 (+) Transcript_22516:152-1060(+)